MRRRALFLTLVLGLAACGGDDDLPTWPSADDTFNEMIDAWVALTQVEQAEVCEADREAMVDRLLDVEKAKLDRFTAEGLLDSWCETEAGQAVILDAWNNLSTTEQASACAEDRGALVTRLMTQVPYMHRPDATAFVETLCEGSSRLDRD